MAVQILTSTYLMCSPILFSIIKMAGQKLIVQCVLMNSKIVLMSVVPTREYYRLKEGIHNIDKNAFFVVMDSYEVKGGA